MKRQWAVVLVGAVLAVGGCSGGGGDGSASSETRSVTHARGTTQVVQHPQRVVTLEPLELDTAVALGITPVGAAVASNVTTMPAYLGVDGVDAVGTVPEPNIEKIAALKPDLILGTEARHAALYERLSKVAPTVYIKTQADPWQDNARAIGDALNRRADVDQLLAEYNARCAAIKAEFSLAGKTAQFIRPRSSQLSLYGPTSFAGSALQCVGFTIPPRDWADGIQADISLENLSTAQADYVFVPSQKPGDASSIPVEIRDNRAWFPRVSVVDTAYWVSGVGPKGGGMVLDDIERILREQR
ncbi:iron complex transport system substrate-binding protein [Tsukamurella pulmonis]|uniref:Iron complex transport system substrate-binding protein n=1 Tax=Tsukamurella pulmonis TaxID=47312 RepID=A0A1H1FVM1_9ACTN|nr:iron-siderophore ABC transporter substrate-binding protein [Tsukamurella pulmonis]SDR05013.1 iron complex transport system substrate-binding protein [Tsukamurella pulmonis]SUP18338.1 Probable siderophore-binding lipoprotein yfiY precursor [Tsukamurella pulmonis]